MVASAATKVDAAAGDVAHGSTGSWHGKDHLRLLPPSANWYCSKIELLDDEAAIPSNRGLMDPSNQAQIEKLMSEVLAAIRQLPDEPAILEKRTDDSDGDEGLSSKQALIIDANDMRSRLTWSEDKVNQ
ncbi:hypothetical protein AM588_10009610 [Phytophthora nicotianae]|uniref:Uncharacterized protein n=1 Tax=Phytophthora nicotianae TaxID=4792 RepID=A0A0W8DTI6_PHYNI|nr:hypothetical protein AM588_10009610 [Phytophthora nicotianae]